MKIKLVIAIVASMTLFLTGIAESVPAPVINKKHKKKSKGITVSAKIKIPANGKTVKGADLTITLWEYNPFLADVGAKNCATLKIKVSHKNGKETLKKFTLPQKVTVNINLVFIILPPVFANNLKTS